MAGARASPLGACAPAAAGRISAASQEVFMHFSLQGSRPIVSRGFPAVAARGMPRSGLITAAGFVLAFALDKTAG
jgi:hypothetical protein